MAAAASPSFPQELHPPAAHPLFFKRVRKRRVRTALAPVSPVHQAGQPSSPPCSSSSKCGCPLSSAQITSAQRRHEGMCSSHAVDVKTTRHRCRAVVVATTTVISGRGRAHNRHRLFSFFNESDVALVSREAVFEARIGTLVISCVAPSVARRRRVEGAAAQSIVKIHCATLSGRKN